MKRTYFVLLLILCYFLLPVGDALAIQPPTMESRMQRPFVEETGGGTVEFLRNLPGLSGWVEDADHFVIGGGFLYWAKCQPEGPRAATSGASVSDSTAANIGYLRRWPIRGGLPVTLSAAAFCDNEHWVADDSGLYYWQDGVIYRRSAAEPLTPTVVTTSARPAGNLIADGNLLYWAVGTSLWQVPKGQTYVEGGRDEAEYMAETGNLFSNLIVSGNRIYWSADGVIRSVDKGCIIQCTVNQLTGEAGFHLSPAAASGPLLGTDTSPHWVSGPYDFYQGIEYTGRDIRGFRCTFNQIGRSCAATTMHTTPDRSDSGGTVRPPTLGPLTDDGNFLFWIENLKICTNSPLGRICNISSSGRLMKWKLDRSFLNNDPFLTPQPIASRNSSGEFNINGTGEVQVADGWVYFITSNGISRIRAAAPPLKWDLAANGMEVTQGVQNLANQNPLVANKPTVVRLYHRKLSGPNIYGVNARLYGSRNGSPLPGSPLRPVNGGLAVNKLNADPDRMNVNDSWIFQLPNEWTNAGSITLSGQIDPRGEVNDPARGNNTSGNLVFTFTGKAPICLVTVPVRTHAPAASNTDPSLFRMADMMRRLIPASDIWLFHQDNDVAQLEARFGIPPWKFTPYALPDKGENVLNSLQQRDLFSDDPDVCDDAGAITHYVGLVHADTPTTKDGITTFGLGRRVSPLPPTVSWIKLMNPWQFVGPDNANQQVNVLVHELTHNYGRLHINCGNPANIDGAYPYVDGMNTNCTLDDGRRNGGTIPGFQRYYGFDLTTLRPISPDGTADFISYGTPYWVSDYTWKALYGRLATRGVVAQSVLAAAAELAAADGVIYAFGIIDQQQNQATLDYLWNLPAEAMSKGMLRKAAYRSTTDYTVQSAAQGTNYHLRLLDADGLPLADRAIELAEPHDPTDNGPRTFGLTFPAPAGAVVRIELLDSETILAAVDAGGNAPVVSIVTPAGGETVGDSLTVTWRATDADPTDRLTFSVQFSPDHGQHWRALVTNEPGQSSDGLTSFTLTELGGLTVADNSALIRVIASDGYNTTTAVSNPFSVTNRKPEPAIVSPTGAGSIAAGAVIVVRGAATDPEEGGIPNAQLNWTLDGSAIGTGEQLSLEGLAPGAYALQLTATDRSGATASTDRTITVAPLAISSVATTPVIDGVCNDDAYAGGAQLLLAPNSDGSQVTVQLVGSGDALYACFIGMARTSGTSPGTLTGLRIDADNSGGDSPDDNDHVVYINEAGVVSTYVGDGAGFVALGGGAIGQVSATATSWHGEIRIDSVLLGGWNHVVRLAASQVWVTSTEDNHFWPYAATVGEPHTWATTVLGTVPTLDRLTPALAAVGTSNMTITVEGSGFSDGTSATWNGAVRPTTTISPTQLQMTVTAADLASAGVATLNVQTGSGATDSEGLRFTIENPAPVISNVTVVDNQVTVRGASFVASSQVIWNGTTLATTAVNGGEVQAKLTTDERMDEPFAEVAVFTPGPGGGTSSTVVPSVGESQHMLFLPFVAR